MRYRCSLCASVRIDEQPRMEYRSATGVWCQLCPTCATEMSELKRVLAAAIEAGNAAAIRHFEKKGFTT